MPLKYLATCSNALAPHCRSGVLRLPDQPQMIDDFLSLSPEFASSFSKTLFVYYYTLELALTSTGDPLSLIESRSSEPKSYQVIIHFYFLFQTQSRWWSSYKLKVNHRREYAMASHCLIDQDTVILSARFASTTLEMCLENEKWSVPLCFANIYSTAHK